MTGKYNQGLEPRVRRRERNRGVRMTVTHHNARYAKLRRQVGKVHFDVFEVWNWLCKGRDTNIVCERQNLSLPVWCVEKIHEIFNIDFRFIKSDPELPLRAKILFVLRVIGYKGNLPQSPAYRDNHIAPLRYGTRQRTSLRFCHKFRYIIGNSQPGKIGTINDWETGWNKTFDFKIRPERAGCDILDVVADSAFRKFHGNNQ